jgi:LmbE family N-acetylglucosaminyl deacetylase
MATLVCFHAHPEDEVIATGGVMAKASSEGHRVVLVIATRGERGEVQPGVLGPDEALWQRRVEEVDAASKLLGVRDHEFLGYVDSGMMGEPSNDDPASFWQADVEEAAARLAAILTGTGADVLTVYDAHGGYGHPDHIQVHRVGVRAAEIAGVARVYEATIDRDRMRQTLEAAAADETLAGSDAAAQAKEMLASDDGLFGMPADQITTRVDVTPWLGVKRAAMRAHASQIGEDSMFLSMPDRVFAAAFGTECFIRRDAPAGLVESDLLG